MSSRYTKGGGGGIVRGGRRGARSDAAPPRYAVLSADTAEDLALLVNRALASGVTLVGGVSVAAAAAYTDAGTLGRVAHDVARTWAQAVLFPPGAPDAEEEEEGGGGGGGASPWGGSAAASPT